MDDDAQIATLEAAAPHPAAVFALLPTNKRARAVLLHPSNRRLVSVVKTPFADRLGLSIGPHIPTKSRNTLARLGREGEVVIEGAHISRIHCSFEVHETSRAILLQDRSSGDSTKIVNGGTNDFDPTRRPRRLLLTPKVEVEVELGSNQEQCARFRIFWFQKLPVMHASFQQQVDPHGIARTLDEIEATPLRTHTRIDTSTGPARTLRWRQSRPLGRGSYGRVVAALDVDVGDAFAVKIFDAHPSRDRYAEVEREVEMLSAVSHPNIIKFIQCQMLGNGAYAIITALNDGSVEHLVEKRTFDGPSSEAVVLLRSMLGALIHLHGRGIIHRDAKPSNILFLRDESSTAYKYQLTDFGVSNFADRAKSNAGTPGFQAPELSQLHCVQTSKMDVWSLLVTMLYVTNHDDFRGWMQTPDVGSSVIGRVQESVRKGHFSNLQAMAELDPKERASAQVIFELVYQQQHGTMTVSRSQSPPTGDIDMGEGP